LGHLNGQVNDLLLMFRARIEVTMNFLLHNFFMHILTSNSMVSHAMWKNTREFLNTSNFTRSLNSCNFDRLWITHSCILFPDCTRNHTNAYTNNYRVYKKRRPLEINHIVKIWMLMIQGHGNLYVCLVTSLVICPVKYRVVMRFVFVV
jgi:hypothetical protein